MKNNTITRREFLKLAAGGGAILCGAAFFAKNIFSQKAATDIFAPQYLRQIITADVARERVIMWQAENAPINAAVEYRLKGRTETAKTPAAEEFFTDDGELNKQYAARLTGLVPGQDYEYRVCADDAASEWYSLRAADDGAFCCLLFPDSQDAFRRNSQAAFFANLGDIVDNGEDSSQWRAWFRAVADFAPNIPFVPVMGNHETYDRQWQVRLPEAYLRYFVVPSNESRDFARYYYSFDYGAAHFIVLNTQWEETENFKAGLREEQMAWLRRDAQNNGKKWKIALLHKDVLQYRIHNRPERQEGFSDVGEYFMPLFDELGIDVVFTAHLHTYRNRGRIFDFRRADHGPLYILTGIAGNVRYPGLWIDHALDETIAPQPETDNYLTLDVTSNCLSIKCFLPDGTAIDSAELQK